MPPRNVCPRCLYIGSHENCNCAYRLAQGEIAKQTLATLRTMAEGGRARGWVHAESLIQVLDDGEERANVG